jgi:hypothetical protein
MQGLFAGSALPVQAQPSGCAQDHQDFGELPAVNVVAGGTLTGTRKTHFPSPCFSKRSRRSFRCLKHQQKVPTDMDDQNGFRVRLRVRLAKGLTTEAKSLNIALAGRSVSVTSQDKNEPLNEAKWVVFHARGFATEKEALQFGGRLRSIVELVCLSLRLGVDVGEDKPTGWVSEKYARALGLIKEQERVAPNVHGLTILPDDDLTRIPIVDIKGVVTANPTDLIAAMEELGDAHDLTFGFAEKGVRLLNLALMTSEPLAQMVLAFSAIEELGQGEKWDREQLGLIEQLAEVAKQSDLPDEQRAEVANAIQTGLFKLSLRQGVTRLLKQLGVSHLKKEWDRLYSIRSGIFHGTARLGNSELNQAAQDTIKLCGTIVFAIISKSGGRLPTTVGTHFNA